MTTHRFKQVDVFTSEPFRGNPVAVVFDADNFSDEQMRAIAGWTNLSETTFFQSPAPGSGADYRLRIYTPRGEIAFAGHPTVGSAHAYIESGGPRSDSNEMRMECGEGVLKLHTVGEGSEALIFTETPEARFTHEFTTSIDVLEQALGARVSRESPPAAFYNGPTWLYTPLESSETIAQLQPDMTALARLSDDFSLGGIAVFALTGSDPAVHIRAFAPLYAVPEDPVTGSANAGLASYLARYGLIERTGREWVAMQGMELGRNGRVHVRTHPNGRTEIGGQCVTVIKGEIRL
jgi:PhzF family phenazine biosynthesis protein